eukprot:363910-Chlamydomonas_euryale.AAC.2
MHVFVTTAVAGAVAGVKRGRWKAVPTPRDVAHDLGHDLDATPQRVCAVPAGLGHGAQRGVGVARNCDVHAIEPRVQQPLRQLHARRHVPAVVAECVVAVVEALVPQ